MTIFESSTSSQSSEGIDIKSEPNFYTSKTNDSESYKHNTNQYPKDGYRYKKFTSRWGHNNHQKQNAREKYGQWGKGVAQILLTYQAIICAALFVSPFITGLMTAQIKWDKIQSCENNCIYTGYT